MFVDVSFYKFILHSLGTYLWVDEIYFDNLVGKNAL